MSSPILLKLRSATRNHESKVDVAVFTVVDGNTGTGKTPPQVVQITAPIDAGLAALSGSKLYNLSVVEVVLPAKTAAPTA